MDIDKAFKQCTTTKKLKDGIRIKCVLGLWAVYAPNKEAALREAKHYFIQYYQDGEYGGIEEYLNGEGKQ